MSFFQEEGDDSNLQYDDAAFLYFIASTLIVASGIIFTFIVRDILSLKVQDRKKLQSTVFLRKKLDNLSALKRKKVLNSRLVIKIVVLVILIVLTYEVYNQSRRNHNKMKGFDPFQILGLSRGATLQQVKKAYRKLALEFHPDKNIGNPDAQARFILISKSYECFTDETKKANCFKFGNPDGVNSFRIGIGLPKLFIKVEYKWYVLPLVLSIFLLIIPAFIVKWANKNSATDPNGVSIVSYKTLFRCLDTPLSKYSGICLLASYKQLYEDLGYGQISATNKKRLFDELQKHPELNLPIIGDFNDKQLNIYWEIYKYLARIEDFSHPEFAAHVEKFIGLTLQALKVFSMKENDGVQILGNPQWTIKFLGTTVIEVVCEFYRDYYNRTLLDLNRRDLWLRNLDLSEEEYKVASAHPIENIYNFLKSNKIDEYVQIFGQGRRPQIKAQMQNLPAYQCQYKMLVDGKEVNSISSYDFAQIKYRITRKNKGNSYCVLSQYPYPKIEEGYMMAIVNGSLIKLQKVQFTTRNYFIGRLQFRWPSLGPIPLFLFFVSTTYSGLDVFTEVKINGINPPNDLVDKKIEFHPEDINIEKTHKSFFQELMTIELDPQENQLSDSDEEQKREEEDKN